MRCAGPRSRAVEARHQEPVQRTASRPVNIVALGAAFGGGLVAGRLGVMAADRFAPARTARRRVPVQEMVTAASSAAVVARFDVGWTTLPPLVAAVSLVTLSATDLRAYRLPGAITFPALGLSLAAVGLESAVSGRRGAVVPAAAAAAGYGSVLWIAHRLRPGGLGFGDVKTGPLLGVHLGWAAGVFGSGWAAPVALVAQALLVSCLISLGMALVVAPLRRCGLDPLPDPGCGSAPGHRRRLRDTALPFGPALAAGTMIVVLFPDTFLG